MRVHAWLYPSHDNSAAIADFFKFVARLFFCMRSEICMAIKKELLRLHLQYMCA